MFRFYDYRPHIIAERNARAEKVAVRLGLATKEGLESGAERLPENLRQEVAARERELASEALILFIKAIRRGQSVFFITVCRPEWTCGAGELSEAHVRWVRDFISRRARRLSRFGQQRLLGFIDIAWNDRRAIGGESHWNVHAHFLLVVEGGEASEEHVRNAFLCRGDGDRVIRPVVIKRPPTDLDVVKLGEYNSRALVLEHHQGRRSYVDREGRLATRDTPLNVAQLNEFAQLMHDLGPQRFWVLSGLRRKHGRIQRHDARGGKA